MSGFLNKNHSGGHITEITLDNDEKVSGLTAAESINKFFCEIGKNLAKEVTPTERVFEVEDARSTFSWSFRITEGKVIKEIGKLDFNKSSGIPQLSNNVLKVCLLHDVRILPGY